MVQLIQALEEVTYIHTFLQYNKISIFTFMITPKKCEFLKKAYQEQKPLREKTIGNGLDCPSRAFWVLVHLLSVVFLSRGSA